MDDVMTGKVSILPAKGRIARRSESLTSFNGRKALRANEAVWEVVQQVGFELRQLSLAVPESHKAGEEAPGDLAKEYGPAPEKECNAVGLDRRIFAARLNLIVAKLQHNVAAIRAQNPFIAGIVTAPLGLAGKDCHSFLTECYLEGSGKAKFGRN